MKTKQILTIILANLVLLCAICGRADDITATGNGNWSSTVPDAPWPDGIVPSTNDSVDIEIPFNVTVDSQAACAFLYGGGNVTMAAGATLDVFGDPQGAFGTQTFGTLDASAPGNTVNYHGNVFWAKRQNYYNLIFSGAGDYFTGAIPGYPATPMVIAGDFTINGQFVKVQQGADITVNGNLSMLGVSNSWDTSVANLTVLSNTFITGTKDLLVDLDGADGSNYFRGNMTVGANALAWNVSDVVTWGLGGSLTNQGLIAGKGFGSISFNGAGNISGKAIKLPTIAINGTYTIAAPITLTTNAPSLSGTLIFDIAQTSNSITLLSYATNMLTFTNSGALMVINSGAAPSTGATYTFINASNYTGTFAPITFPALPSGLSWIDNTAVNGSIMVSSGVSPGAPKLTASFDGTAFTLSWDTATYPGYTLQAQTNNGGGLGTNWTRISNGNTSPFNPGYNPSNSSVFFRLVKP